MASTINADRGIVSGITGIVQTADNTGNLTLQANGVSVLTVNTSNAVTVTGTISATGNIAGLYFIGNGSGLTGVATSGGVAWTTQANTAPANATAGSFWYDSYAQIKYQYINDGTSNVWVDQSPPTSFSTITVSGTATVGNVGATGNITAGGLVSATGNITGGNLSVSTGTATVGNIVNGNGNGVGNIGTSSVYFNTAFIKATSAQYADLAEMYVADQDYPPGTVVDFGGEKEITATTVSHSVLVAGIISTNPSYLMNATQEGEHVLPVALTGRVPCQVIGTINKGDRLVASTVQGVATKLDQTLYEPGCIIGKALESYSADEVGTIEVAVGRF